ncbi:glycoside hydrolase family 31 protein [Baudoinia panamericana UAMH 10762]|uniref:alpha-glucosidase n=1 Tax=Baudoinia panamericana (strain UAMH 10762) TaxID=717646 RepID=M2LVU9_BAUPA|nr:glycoside hydrolase family 31 protein [Baudoinia panamericana UAMH 10762]EMC98792.1 glycoside hydrolase family 31 protein [Baudoinia panamericana UAMH 10762]
MAFLRVFQLLLSTCCLVTAQLSTSNQGATSGSSLPTPTYSIGTATINGTATTYSVAFTVPAAVDVGPNVLPNVKNSTAKQAQVLCPGYKASNVQRTAYGLTATLALAGQACNVYGTDIETLALEVDVQSADRLHVSIQPAYLSSSNISQYILSPELVNLPSQAAADVDTQDIDLQFVWSNEPTFSFTILRKSTGDVLFDTRGSVLVYENQFIEFVSQLPQNYNLYGLGERIHSLRLGNNFTATFYAADAGNPPDYGLYGSHPFYLDTRYYEVSATGQRTLVTTQNTTANGTYESLSHGVYLRNSHGLEALLLPTNLTWRTLGGSIDLYVFDGPTAEAVTQQYHTGATGLPAMQQYFTFGFHQCRWGYKNWSMVQDVVNNYRAFDIPLETVWNDIDYMFQYRDFTNDQNTFSYAEGEAFLAQLHAAGQHYVPIVDSAIYIPNPNNASDNYSIYTDGNDNGVFLRNPDGSQYIGNVWPGFTVFPDWHSDQAVPWWTRSMQSHHNNVPWDGIWIDMSEVSSFCIGSCGTHNLSLNPVHPPFGLPGEPGSVDYTFPEGFNITNATEAAAASSASGVQASSASAASPPSTATTPYFISTVTPGVRNVNQPPYVINNVQGDLAVHAVSPNATHIDGVEEYDVHNLFGHQILNATYQALTEIFPGKRPFIIGRSTFVGTGVWAGHWGGDNNSLFAYMYWSIAQALSFSLFGIPMFGVDTCGFSGNSDEELCNRWMQLSAFFPFYRNHNVLAATSQEAYVWASVAEASRVAMRIRYSLLPYMYTLFYFAHTTGSTVMRALTWEFPNDPTLAAIDNQFLLGPSLLITPVLGQGMTTAHGVFPGVAQGEVWYDWYTQQAVNASAGENVTIPAPLGHIPVFVRGGYILPQQEALYTTSECRNSSWSLLCALSAEGTATGSLYVDDGESIVPPATLFVDFTASNGSLYTSARGTYEDTISLANVTIMGVATQPRTVTLNGQEVRNGVNYNSTSKVLSIKGLQQSTCGGAWASDWVLSWK